MDGQHDTFSSPRWVLNFPAGPHYGLQSSDKSGFSYTFFFSLFLAKEL
jgi:hypothetical protein